MQRLKRVHLLLVLLTLSFFIPTSIAQQTPISFCGKIRNGTPFFLQNSSVETSLLNRMVLCKSQKLYFRTSLGLFPISSIDYTSKLLTISHTTCSSSLHFISPSLLSAGFPPPPQPNSLILFNCSNQRNHLSRFLGNCTGFHGCKACSQIQKQELEGTSSCLLVEDLGKLEKGFDPKDLNCSHYSPAYKNTTVDEDIKGFELGTRISFDIPDHVPNICDECEKPHGNCGVGLKCICHPKECKDKVISVAVTMHPFGNIILSLLSSIFVMLL
ncbi:hypothetical protein F0562_022159 [Nyssa sinensis]|uniref:Wall-associated receptor kinase C-terminal domain-containing protein n=1 Tax=Nyssa sinensis TaxID=561372 RepID=A0A5J5BM40_9ASTE|nr:hypothetical protein F0562_022159 [Nyssa sinensis]